MTTTPDHREPLDDERSDEERDLAARLGRLGPFDGPPPALDARILAAAHAAAVARTSSRRRLAWLGVPPALVTGMGVAAAAVLALGLVWQLRPQPGVVMSRGEADIGEEVILIAEPAGSARAPAVNPPPVPEEHAAADASATRPQPAAAPARAQTSQESAKVVDLQSKAEAAAAGESAALAAQAASVDEERREAERALRDAASEQGFVAGPPAVAAPASAHKHATYTTAARARAEQRQRAAANVASAPAAPASAPPEYDAAPASAAASAEAQTLDRIEVTGSRIVRDRQTDWSQVPVSDDTHLAAAEWLERIRARRDDEDTDGARASLRLFQREYPRVRLPDDLRELLADAER